MQTMTTRRPLATTVVSTGLKPYRVTAWKRGKGVRVNAGTFSVGATTSYKACVQVAKGLVNGQGTVGLHELEWNGHNPLYILRVN